ncbi:MAG: DNA-3-methyladenine glycosylase I [Phycisphaerales bacterium]|jgi:DNA-3-methyladenine glycosylase I|nr:DNA-3-methyladenine glycosylase I [Phycisphaerales bacterium]
MTMNDRCPWCGDDPQYVAYHDEEWGVPVRDDIALFNKLTLDTFQSGLSWLVVLRKRDDMVRLLSLNEPQDLAQWSDRQVSAVLEDARIIRNRAKVEAAVNNARRFCELRDAGRGFGDLLWSHVGGTSIVNAWSRDDQVPATSAEGDTMSAELKSLGFKWTGPTVCYAFMQAVGMVNDHLVSCGRYRACV